MIWLLFVSLVVGVLIGAVGIGGILLIPALNVLGGLTIHEAMATALFTFIFTGAIGTVSFQRRGSIDWSITVPLCLGAAIFGFLGAWANAKVDARGLSLILSSIIIFAGIYTISTRSLARPAILQGRPRMQQALLISVGAVVGFGSGLTGVGGPALSVPMMILLGFSPLTTIGASQVIQILAGVSGTVGNMQYGSINYKLVTILTIFEVIGVLVGARIVHAVNAQSLRGYVGVLCILVGAGLMMRALGFL
ncbi:MAG: sulfite exporter TauE/SafE family protein [Anaerolineales bacterium]|nr:sulfite exporter TauE/SafE family protein [Anaerolineales bacterium]